MGTYFFFGRYSENALKEISAKRTETAVTVEQFDKLAAQV